MAELSTFRGVLHPSPMARALREYADRWHGRVGDPVDFLTFPDTWSAGEVEAFKTAFTAANQGTQPIRLIPAGASYERQTTCQCGRDAGEDGGCPERRQLLADADAIEQGRDFTEVTGG